MTDFSKIANSLTREQKAKVQTALKINKDYIRNFSKYKPDVIYLLFAEWDRIFPANKQDVKCSSCRAAVLKFWDEINKIWLEEKPKKKQKNKKPVKHKTQAGALAKGVGVSK